MLRVNQVGKSTIALLVLAVEALRSSSQQVFTIPPHLVPLLINLAICSFQSSLVVILVHILILEGEVLDRCPSRSICPSCPFIRFKNQVRSCSLTISESLSSHSTSEWCLIHWPLFYGRSLFLSIPQAQRNLIPVSGIGMFTSIQYIILFFFCFFGR